MEREAARGMRVAYKAVRWGPAQRDAESPSARRVEVRAAPINPHRCGSSRAAASRVPGEVWCDVTRGGPLIWSGH